MGQEGDTAMRQRLYNRVGSCRVCDEPSSEDPHEWPEDITKWPVSWGLWLACRKGEVAAPCHQWCCRLSLLDLPQLCTALAFVLPGRQGVRARERGGDLRGQSGINLVCRRLSLGFGCYRPGFYRSLASVSVSNRPRVGCVWRTTPAHLFFFLT